ncbi:MAG: hypothetical protein P0Y55_06720 [Candidatus Cohnella colombiensis]|uniref:Tetratricopeptide repeat protein n=1 Tax=Candidatus Cohnella colombiensis TaxID=3121368 RepID=A0AA95JBR5_9BACL|nr:MAG: hypothetical protein P0Y55_06720 [Cohnella sp.]
MIQQWFATMNEMLDDLIIRYPDATGEERKQLADEWNVLKTLSDVMIESWLQLEDKMGVYREMQQQQNVNEPNEQFCHPFLKGHGYFRLQMFSQASQHLEEVVHRYPDFISARLFLALSQMHLQQWATAQHHLQLVVAVTDDNKLQAIAFNALGCIQAIYARLDYACGYFRKALEYEPAFEDAHSNLESCQQGKEQLELQFCSTEWQDIVPI